VRLKSFEVVGLLGAETSLQLVFNDDINIITGRNGSGKTSLLKLVWYIMSGNILLALREVQFKKATLQTDKYTCTVFRLSAFTCRIDWEGSDGSQETFEDIEDSDGDVVMNAEDQANRLLIAFGSSVFLPTFRRIEGGFTSSERNASVVSRARGDIEESLIALSKRLSHERHVFVAALSTVDVVTLLVQKYADLSEQYNRLQRETSQEIIESIKEFKADASEPSKPAAANKVLDDIRIKIERMDEARGTIMRPLEAVQDLAISLFRKSGIKLGKNLSFGDAANAINSDALSAGEKQMLSFIAYNAFYSGAVVLIDEPELSLHVDWQRQLFPILLGQKSSNQFIVATHSPFIYGKYPDKEVQIDPQRGDEGV
jgi:predicted ATPase